jgi:hypothetical protein
LLQELQLVQTSLDNLKNKYRQETQNLQDKIARMEAENNEKKVSLVHSESAKTGKAPQIQKTKPEAPPQSEKSESGQQESYRYIRLNSLASTLANQDPAARKKILVSVIPTIPDGINGAELLALVNGMDGHDILEIIETTSQYIVRPLDARTLSSLAAFMNEADAATATQILSAR